MEFINKIVKTEHRDKKILKKMKLLKKDVMLFGAGSMAIFTLKNLYRYGIKPICFCDNDPQKQGGNFFGLPVLSYEVFKKKNKRKNYFIIISTSAYCKEIYNWLKKQKEKNPIFFEMYACDPFSKEPTNYNFVKDNINEFEKVYNFFKDKLSKETMVKIINFKISGDRKYVDKIYRKNIYFDKNIIKLNNNEVYMDIGAYTGDSIDRFIIATAGKYKKIIAIEPDRNNFFVLKKHIRIKKYKNVELYNICVLDRRGTINFLGGLAGSSGIMEENFLLKQQNYKVNVIKIDDIMKDNKVDIIKMDIEGSELKALKGCEKTIRKWKPQLAISVYHRREDLLNIPLMIKSIVPEYKLYLRHYSKSMLDTVLYAVI